MKAQRRHDLQTNTLARVITRAPNFWQESGGKLLLGAVVVLALVLLVRFRISSNREAAAKAAESLNLARNSIDELAASAQYPPSAEVSNRRRSLASEAGSAIEEVSRLSDDRPILAEALMAKGDLNWTMANMPQMSLASTSSTQAAQRDSGELLNSAADAYRTVINNYGDLQSTAIRAHFGLAAVSENRRDFDAAEREYKTILTIPGLAQAYVDLAKNRLDKLPALREPVLIGQATSMPAVPPMPAATQPRFSTLGPAITSPGARGGTQPSSKPVPLPPGGPAPSPLKPKATSTVPTR